MHATPFKGAVRYLAAIAVLAIAACTPMPGAFPLDSAAFTRLEQTSTALVTLGWLTTDPGQKRQSLVVVIEGDGAAWSPNGAPPQNPTPRSGIGARLSSVLAKDRSLLYLARPCQYLSEDQMDHCSFHHWTDKRFGQQPLAALDRLISQVQTKDRKIILVGFSGGGLLAAELALLRQDVAGLITVAAPLDLSAWTTLHHISSLETVRPAEELLDALFLADFPQYHLYGTHDQVVPPSLAADMALRLPAESVRWVEGLGHDDNWVPAVTDALIFLENKEMVIH